MFGKDLKCWGVEPKSGSNELFKVSQFLFFFNSDGGISLGRIEKFSNIITFLSPIPINKEEIRINFAPKKFGLASCIGFLSITSKN